MTCPLIFIEQYNIITGLHTVTAQLNLPYNYYRKSVLCVVVGDTEMRTRLTVCRTRLVGQYCNSNSRAATTHRSRERGVLSVQRSQSDVLTRTESDE
jgi:hypothetical protein